MYAQGISGAEIGFTTGNINHRNIDHRGKVGTNYGRQKKTNFNERYWSCYLRCQRRIF